MRRVLVLNRYRLASAAFHRWIGDAAELYLVNDGARTYRRAPDRDAIEAGYAQIVEVDDYLDDATVLPAARDLIARHGIDTVIAFSEYDVLRAARLRTEFGLAGQDVASAELFRDKLAMKRRAQTAGIPVVPFAPLGSSDDEVARLGYPLIVKPRHGADSQGVVVVRDASELARVTTALDDPTAYLAEQYVEHELLHTDGVVVDGELRFFEAWQWSQTLLASHQDASAPTVALTLDARDPRRAELRDLTRQALLALGAPPVTAFHVEFFATDHGLLLNEAASRIGGARIQPALRRIHGVDLAELTARCTVEPRAAVTLPPPLAPAGGFLLVYGTPDGRTGAPATCPLPGVADYETTVPLAGGDTMNVAHPELVVSATAVGRSRDEVRSRLDDFNDWFVRSTTA